MEEAWVPGDERVGTEVEEVANKEEGRTDE